MYSESKCGVSNVSKTRRPAKGLVFASIFAHPERNQPLRHQMGEYTAEMRTNLEELCTSPGFPKDRDHEGKDFITIYNRQSEYRLWAEKLVSIITTYISLTKSASTQAVVSNSKSLSRLAILGFSFVPFSFVASFFSMGSEFAVGGRRLWVYLR